MKLIRPKNIDDDSSFLMVVSNDNTTCYGTMGRIRDMEKLKLLHVGQEPNPWAWVFIDGDGDLLYELDPVILLERALYRIRRFG